MSECVTGGPLEGETGQLACPSCGHALVAVLGPESLAFHCQSGHVTSPEGLVATRSERLRRGLDQLLVEWEKAFDFMVVTARDAHYHGFDKIAQIFIRQTRHMALRIRIVRRAMGIRRLSPPVESSPPTPSAA